MSYNNGPSEGTWSVFTTKVVNERDEIKEELFVAKQEIIRLNSLIKDLQFQLLKAKIK